MRIVFVRHGHPDYVNDCLTALGHEQAEKASHRLKNEGITEIYSSSMGRACETALHTAEKLGLEVKKLDFIREIRWGSDKGEEVYKDGHPWDTSIYAIKNGFNLMDEAWTKDKMFSGNKVFSEVERVGRQTDDWLLTLGYKREGTGYRVVGDNTDRTIALFGHGGASSALFSHLLNLPFFYLCGTLCPDFTAITVLRLSDEKGELTVPLIEIANDSRHISGEKVTFDM